MTTQNNTSQSRKPVKTFRGAKLSVRVWENEYQDTQTGEVRTYHQIDHQRCYRKNNSWKYTSSISKDDAPLLISLYQQAYDWSNAQDQITDQADQPSSQDQSQGGQ